MYLLALHVFQQIRNPLCEFENGNRVSHGIVHMPRYIAFIVFASCKSKVVKVAMEIAI